MRLLWERFLIAIWTCREGKELMEMVRFLEREQIPFDFINFSPYLNTRKLFAFWYLDDRNFGGFVGWDRVIEALSDFQPMRASPLASGSSL